MLLKPNITRVEEFTVQIQHFSDGQTKTFISPIVDRTDEVINPKEHTIITDEFSLTKVFTTHGIIGVSKTSKFAPYFVPGKEITTAYGEHLFILTVDKTGKRLYGGKTIYKKYPELLNIKTLVAQYDVEDNFLQLSDADDEIDTSNYNQK